ncbi:hypothetical protein V565_138890, partial [Rhizoctonia solani 123E]
YIIHTTFKLSRAFVVAAVLSSTVLCVPVPQNARKPISTGQSTDPSAPASSVFDTTPQDPNYQAHPTELCVVPTLARDAGLSQGQEQLTARQAMQLCSDARSISVSSKNTKRSPLLLNGSTLVPLPFPEPQPDTLHPVRSVDRDDKPPKAEAPQPPAPEPLPGAPQPPMARDLPPQPALAPQPEGLPRPVVVRSNAGQPLKDGILPPPASAVLPGAHEAHAPRDVPPQLEPVPQPASVPAPQPEAPHPAVIRSQPPPPPPSREAPSQSGPSSLHPVAARSVPEQPPTIEAPASEHIPGSPAPPHPRAVARSQGQPQHTPQPEPIPEPVPQPNAPGPNARAERPQVPRPNAEAPPQPEHHSGASLPAGN